MKKVNTSPRAQARRTRALARFTLNPSKLKADDASGYKARKDQELAALKQRLGV
jgi:hypothetical protein